MKAKEYAEMFNQDPTLSTFRIICNKFAVEASNMLKNRNVGTMPALVAVFKEQDLKWKAFCRLVKDVKPNGFRVITKEVFPEIYQAMERYWD